MAMTVLRPKLTLGGVHPHIDIDVRTEVHARLEHAALRLLATLDAALMADEIDTRDVSRLSQSVSTVLAEWRKERDPAEMTIEAEIAKLEAQLADRTPGA